MKKIKSIIVFTLRIAFISCFFSNCMNEKGIPDYQSFPDDVGRIVFTKCATTGCHNDASKDASGGLSMQSWDKLFQGGRGSACVIPYRSDYSTLCYYTNTFADLGVTLAPTMPYNRTALSREDVTVLKNWIDAGAPNRDGFVKFSDNTSRKKIYVTNQGCDVVTVMDAATLLPMRYINVGNSPSHESPHNIKVSPDGQFWYVISTGGNSLQKYRTSDDSYVGEAILGIKNWNTITISLDGATAYVVDWSSPGDIASVNTNTLITSHHTGFTYPHGSCLNPAGTMLYVTQQNNSNAVYKIDLSDPSFLTFSDINLFTTTPPADFLNSHEIMFSPDGSEYFVTCQGGAIANAPEVRIMQASNDSLLAVIPVGTLPSEMAISPNNSLLFVTCEEDTTVAGQRGSVYIIDFSTNTPAYVPKIYTGHQPHGISVDDSKNLVFVANRNQTTGGPAPHHSSNCGGKDGYMTFIDMSNLTLLQAGTIPKKVELSVDPYSVAVRH